MFVIYALLWIELWQYALDLLVTLKAYLSKRIF